MKKTIAILLSAVAVLSCLVFCGCEDNYDDWHNTQIERGMREARKQLGR